jgi:hypothetical protein
VGHEGRKVRPQRRGRHQAPFPSWTAANAALCPKTVSNPFLATGGSGCDRLVQLASRRCVQSLPTCCIGRYADSADSADCKPPLSARSPESGGRRPARVSRVSRRIQPGQVPAVDAGTGRQDPATVDRPTSRGHPQNPSDLNRTQPQP